MDTTLSFHNILLNTYKETKPLSPSQNRQEISPQNISYLLNIINQTYFPKCKKSHTATYVALNKKKAKEEKQKTTAPIFDKKDLFHKPAINLQDISKDLHPAILFFWNHMDDMSQLTLTKSQLKKAFRQIAKKLHPDTQNQNDAQHLEKSSHFFQELKKHYKQLSLSQVFQEN